MLHNIFVPRTCKRVLSILRLFCLHNLWNLSATQRWMCQQEAKPQTSPLLCSNKQSGVGYLDTNKSFRVRARNMLNIDHVQIQPVIRAYGAGGTLRLCSRHSVCQDVSTNSIGKMKIMCMKVLQKRPIDSCFGYHLLRSDISQPPNNLQEYMPCHAPFENR